MTNNENYARFLRSGRKPKRERKNRKLLGFGNGHFSSQWRKIPSICKFETGRFAND